VPCHRQTMQKVSPLLQAKQAQLLQPFLIGEVPQHSDCLVTPFWTCSNSCTYFFTYWGPRPGCSTSRWGLTRAKTVPVNFSELCCPAVSKHTHTHTHTHTHKTSIERDQSSLIKCIDSCLITEKQ